MKDVAKENALSTNEEAVTESRPSSDFIREIVAADNRSGKHGGRVAARFP